MDIRALQKLGAGNQLKSVLLHLRITAGITEIKKNKIERAYGRVRIVCEPSHSVCVCMHFAWLCVGSGCSKLPTTTLSDP